MIKFFIMFLAAFFVSISVSPIDSYASDDNQIMSDSKKAQYTADQKDIFSTIKTSITTTNVKLQAVAKKILYWVSLIGVVLIGMKFIFSDSNFQAFFAEFCKFILLVGMLLYTIEHADYIVSYIESFAMNTLDNDKTTNMEDLLINRLLDTILVVATKVESSGWTDAIVYTILGAIIVGLVTVILINFIIILVKMYLVVNVGIIAVALAGCSFTNKYALNYMRECISYALQLLSILAICLVVDTIMEKQFTVHAGIDDSEILATVTDYFVTIAIIAIFASLSVSVPNTIGSLVDSNGSSNITPIAAAAATYKAAKWALSSKSQSNNATDNTAKEENSKDPESLASQPMTPAVSDIKTGLTDSSSSNNDSQSSDDAKQDSSSQDTNTDTKTKEK